VIGPPKWEKHLTTDEQGRIAMPTPGLADTFWKLLTSKQKRVATKMISSIASATLHHSRSYSGRGFRGPPNVKPQKSPVFRQHLAEHGLFRCFG
jgi:hypothetical protein